jgi:hypothetical protein
MTLDNRYSPESVAKSGHGDEMMSSSERQKHCYLRKHVYSYGGGGGI